MNNKKVILFAVICVCLCFSTLFHPQAAFAHRMVIEQVEDGLVHVRYDDGASAGLAIVSAFDEDGELLDEGETDEDGYFHYEKGLDVHRFAADDGMGHRATFVSGEENTVDTIPLYIRALLGVSILLFTASSFYYRSKKTKR
ncbi:hypothetical protein KFZ58_12615 [Virgibacillus sp. NKC19-16]|uniref:hypothetical protein n=1 Tax=Virgibacillus salidurans TaxID=2831673 RepID=UPI001F1849AD|nr:hypothetical protein [Virgibacillus sp. NKC19-16]UJL45250.1 hypothetical protein KFZ58_12615 [Virgibacillus sp. NKC19-16]